jgi:hypothetical protein
MGGTGIVAGLEQAIPELVSAGALYLVDFFGTVWGSETKGSLAAKVGRAVLWSAIIGWFAAAQLGRPLICTSEQELNGCESEAGVPASAEDQRAHGVYWGIVLFVPYTLGLYRGNRASAQKKAVRAN